MYLRANNFLKSFLKFTWAKVLLMMLFMGLTYFIPKTAEICSMGPTGIVCGRNDANGLGLPIFWGDQYSGDVMGTGFYWKNFIINIVEFYSLAAIISCFFKNRKTQEA